MTFKLAFTILNTTKLDIQFYITFSQFLNLWVGEKADKLVTFPDPQLGGLGLRPIYQPLGILAFLHVYSIDHNTRDSFQLRSL